ncbi:hypothetical protein PMIN03_001909 [Paraphaeosphaeria minitans]|uniref:Uncharacterized protein n=1 Tax=Paraphaeosphaeria minitans TaxID=565426 RepID=A0A9P6GQF2_9PLEO|nr:hypothetical protein PMIN01_02617 [Paraphaeosphaeria minitans]
MGPQKEHQQAKKGAQAGFNPFTKNTGVTKNSKSTTGTRRPADSNAATDTKSNSDHRFFTADGLHIPLYDARGKRIAQARDGRVVAHKISRQRVLDEYVRKYAGDNKVEEMEGKTQGAQKWSKNQIADWITEVETRAYGQGPKGMTMKERGGGNGTKTQRNGPGGKEDAPKGKVTSKIEQMMALPALDEESEEKSAPVLVSDKTFVDTSDVAVTKRGHVGTPNGDANGKRKLPAPDSQVATKKIKLDRKNAELLSSVTAPVVAATSTPAEAISRAPPEPELDTSINMPPRKHKPGIATEMPAPKRKPVASSSMALPTLKPAVTSNTPTNKTSKAQLPHKPEQKPTPPNNLDGNNADDDLYLPASVSRLNALPTHPFLSTFSLDPTFQPMPACTSSTTPLRTLTFPSSRAHLLISTTSLNRDSPTVHLTLIPHRDLENQRAATLAAKKIGPPHRRRRNMMRAFLKPGTHGWDYDKHRWGFEGDADLKTGRGHQVEPEDERKLEAGEMSWAAFGDKYPGVRGGRGGMWPCGCGVGEEGESEEE